MLGTETILYVLGDLGEVDDVALFVELESERPR